MAKFNLRNFFSSLSTTGNLTSSKNTERAAKLKSGVASRPLFRGNTKLKHSDKFWKAYGVSTMLETVSQVAGSSGDTYPNTATLAATKLARRAGSMPLGGSAQG